MLSTTLLYLILITNDFTTKELINMLETVTLSQFVAFDALNQALNVGFVPIMISVHDVRIETTNSKLAKDLHSQKVL